jgi:serine/threonine-protein kinase
MSTLEGGISTLEDRLRNEGRIPLRDVARLVRDVLEDLSAFHARGVIHRDVRPATIVLEHGRARLVDQKPRAPRVSKPTRSGTLPHPSCVSDDGARYDATLATFYCMAPEQVRGSAEVDPRADVYGIGAVAFRALTGRSPFESANALVLIALKLDRDPPSLSEMTGEAWPPELERFARLALARDPAARFASATEALGVWTRACGRWLPQPS